MYMRLPLCDDDALYASRRLKRHQRRFDIAEKRDGESEREIGEEEEEVESGFW